MLQVRQRTIYNASIPATAAYQRRLTLLCFHTNSGKKKLTF
jgi:hypothetical protein